MLIFVRDFLESLLRQFHRKELLSSDPLEWVKEESDPWDQEAVAVLASQVAYGNVKQIRAFSKDAVRRMKEESGTPSAWVRSLSNRRGVEKAKRAFQTFRYRFQKGEDWVALFSALSQTWKKECSLGNAISRRYKGEADFGSALSSLLSDWKAEIQPKSASLSHLLSSPSDGSACKRWAMFFRWMVRSDELDPGTWTEKSELGRKISGKCRLEARHLILPLDTHTSRISRYLRLTERKTTNWGVAQEITGNLRRLDPMDPVKYDFALSRLGILDLCQKRYRAEICGSCALLPACGFAASHA